MTVDTVAGLALTPEREALTPPIKYPGGKRWLVPVLQAAWESCRRPRYVDPIGVVTRLSTDVLAVGDADVAAALKFICDHVADKITVGDVVEHVSISYSSLKERFRRLLGRSVHDEILHVKIKRVKQLLAQTDMSLTGIARKVGFRHQEYMGAVFKAKAGKTPGQYRKEARL